MRSLTRRLIAVEQIGGDDLEIVVGGVGEGAAAVAVAERPDARDIGGQAVVDDDVAARVGCDAGLVEAEIVRIRSTPDGQQDMRADHLGGSPDVQSTPTATPSACGSKRDAFGVGPHRDTLALEDLAGSPRRRPRPRARSAAAPFSTTVTCAPKRRYIWANSSPI